MESAGTALELLCESSGAAGLNAVEGFQRGQTDERGERRQQIGDGSVRVRGEAAVRALHSDEEVRGAFSHVVAGCVGDLQQSNRCGAGVRLASIGLAQVGEAAIGPPTLLREADDGFACRQRQPHELPA